MVRNEKTRQYIIEKTAPIFNKKGYVGTYLSDLTEATGLTKGSIYGNFKNKNEVALEAFKYNYRLQTQQLNEKLEKAPTASDQLMAFLDHYRQTYKTIFENGGCAILNTAVDADNGNDILREEVILKIRNWSDRITHLLDKGIENDELIAIDTRAYSYQMISMIEGSILIAKTLGKPDILLQHIELLEQNILQLKKTN